MPKEIESNLPTFQWRGKEKPSGDESMGERHEKAIIHIYSVWHLSINARM